MESHNVLDLIAPVLLILGGVLAAAALIVTKRPDAARYIAKIQPYQALIGFALLAIGIWTLIRSASSLPGLISTNAFYAAAIIVTCVASMMLGVLFGMPVLSGFSPQGAAKGRELAERLAPFQVLIGIVGIAGGAFNILLWFGVPLNSLN